MKRVCLPLALVALGALLASPPASAQSCSIGGHNETSENFAPGGWSIIPGTPGTIAGAPSGTHLVISEVAPRGAGAGSLSDSSEYVEIYNPTSKPVSLDDKYISDDSKYYQIVNGTYTAVNTTDWALKFPAGLALSPGRTLVLCVTKTGFAGSGASAPGAQYFLEMKDSNGSGADDMIIMTTNTIFTVTGGMMTNASSTNGEWVVLYCWNGTSDLVCDIDYASWGVNSASNPKMDKSGISIDGPDAGTGASAYNNDTPAASQTNLGNGTQLTKPNTYQRTGGEVGEITTGGNGCIGRAIPTAIDWLPVAGTSNIRFHVRWQNPDNDNNSAPINGALSSQPFGVFLPDYGSIGSFAVPPLQPSSFFDVFIEVPLDQLPPKPNKILPGGGPGGTPGKAPTGAFRGGTTIASNCPPDTNWAGNVDLFWSAAGQTGQALKHYGDLVVCPGGGPSYIHMRSSNCPNPMPWSIAGLCPGFSATLVNEDLSPTPNPAPAGWTGYICVSAPAGTPVGASCCFDVVFNCNGSPGTVDLCVTTCDWSQHSPTLTVVDWTTTGTTVQFHQHWENQNASSPSNPVSGDMSSQRFGVFLPNFGPIGHFDVPAIAPSSFFDIFFDVDLSQLPPEPVLRMPGGGPPPGSPCAPPIHWHGNVDVTWNGPGGTGEVHKHFGEMPVCPGAGPTYLFVETDCNSSTGAGATWSISGLCPGFSATLVNPDSTPAPNPVPAGWIGLICVSATATTPSGTTCCFTVNFLCDGAPGVIDVCAKTCNWAPKKPVLMSTDWTRVGSAVRFHMVWSNPDNGSSSDPVSGDMRSQPFGAFAPTFGDIGHFDVPPIPPASFFDVFLEVPLSTLPPPPAERLPGGGPAPGSPCPPDTSWSGNVDIMWSGAGGSGQVNRHFTGLLVRPGSGSSHVHTLVFCNSTAGATWSIAGLCPGFTAALLNENFTPAPNPVPPNWTGWISVAAAGSVPPGTSCCFTVTFVCDGAPGVIDVCAQTCVWANSDVPLNATGVDFGIYSTAPNPTSTGMVIGYAMPKAGLAKLDVYNLSGQRVRRLLDGQAEAGSNAVRWDGRGENGRFLAPGAYFVTLKAGERVASKKVVLFH